MAVNLDLIKKKLQQMQQQSTGSGSKTNENIWKPPVGKSQIRIVPYKFDKGNPFQEMYFHYEIGKKTMLSPTSYGKPDPIVEFSDKLKRSGNKDDWKLGKKIEPKFRVIVPIVVRGEEEKGVKYWSFGKQIYTELLGIMADPDYGDITDPINGRDITVEHIAPEKEGAFPTYTIRVKPNTTAVTTDKEIATKIMTEQVETKSLFTEYSYEELAENLQKWLDPSNEEDSKKPKTDKVSTARTATQSEDIASAFDELFNNKK